MNQRMFIKMRYHFFYQVFFLASQAVNSWMTRKKNDKNFIEKFGLMILRLT